jgi:hypothetical protein
MRMRLDSELWCLRLLVSAESTLPLWPPRDRLAARLRQSASFARLGAAGVPANRSARVPTPVQPAAAAKAAAP